MASQATVSLVGNCTEPEVKVLPDGTDLVTFSIATNAWSKSGDITSWWRVSVFGNRCKGLITLMNKGMFMKGTLVAAVGEVSQRPYTAKDGSERMSVDVRAHDVTICFPPKEQGGNYTPGNYGGGYGQGNYGDELSRAMHDADEDMNAVPF